MNEQKDLLSRYILQDQEFRNLYTTYICEVEFPSFIKFKDHLVEYVFEWLDIYKLDRLYLDVSYINLGDDLYIDLDALWNYASTMYD